MISAQNCKKWLLQVPTACASNATTALTVDTMGYDYATIDLITGSSGSAAAQALTIYEGDSSSAVTSAVVTGGTDFTLPNMFAAATNKPLATINVDLRGRKRYLKVAFTPSTDGSANVTGLVTLSRAENSPVSASQVNSQVVVNA